MEKFDIYILGCGSAIPTKKHLPSCQVLNIREKLFMVDCAEGCQLQVRGAQLHFSRLSHIFISHLHGDHCFGLMGIISTFDLLGRTSQLHIYSPGQTLEKLMRPWLDFFCRGLKFEVVFHSFSSSNSELIYNDKSLSVRTIPLKHRVPCCGFLFEEKAMLPHIKRDMIDYLHIPPYAINGIKAGGGWIDSEGRNWHHEELTIPALPGRRYAYLSDTMIVPQNADIVRGVDLLYHEATYSHCDVQRARETCHSTSCQAAEFALSAEVKALLIGHFSARYEDDNLLLEEAKEVFKNTKLANEGLKIEL